MPYQFLILRRMIFCVIVLSMLGGSPQVSRRTVYLAVAPLEVSLPFYGRMTDGINRLVVTSNKDSEWVIKKVGLDAEEGLFLVEFLAPPPPLVGEQYRMGRIVALKARSIEEADYSISASGEHVHAIAVGSELFVSDSTIENSRIENPRKVTVPDFSIVGSNTPEHRLVLPDLPLEEIQRNLEEFTGAVSTTIGGVEVLLGERKSILGREKARAWLSERYQALGMNVSIHDYGGGRNFVAEKPGRDPSLVLIVSSHYDTVSTAGADDDGAGTISALAVATSLANEDTIPSIRFVAFDQEEIGLLGSQAYAKKMKDAGEISRLEGVINLEMTGFDRDNDGAFHTIDCNENSSATLSNALMRFIEATGLALHRIEACTNRSDHASFWTYDRPAIVVSQNFFGGDSNPCYHRSCDTTEKMNWVYFHKVTQASAGLVRQLAL